MELLFMLNSVEKAVKVNLARHNELLFNGSEVAF